MPVSSRKRETLGTGPRADDVSSYNSIPAMFFERARNAGDAPRYMVKRGAGYEFVTWPDCARRVREIACALVDMGLMPGDHVAILSSTRPEWLEVDIAALAIGCVTVPIYPSNLPFECGFILQDSNSRTALVENASQADKLRRVNREGIEVDGRHVEIPISNVVVFDGEVEGAITLEALLERGRSTSGKHEAEIDRRTRAIASDDLATIVYTSGTTGLPKGVLQTHANHLAALDAVAALGVARSGEIDFSFLPYAHSFGRMMEYLGLYLGTITAYAEKIDTIMGDLALARPHLMPAVPRIYEKFYAAVQRSRDESSSVARGIFDWAIDVGTRRARYVHRNERVPAFLRLMDQAAHALVFGKIHARLGGCMRIMISGGAPLSREINEFFHAVGLPIYEGYGLTETTPILTSNSPGNVRLGTVGRPMKGVSVRIAPDGEILAKGPNVAAGYHNRPADTAEAWGDDGWFRTGDIGELVDGYLRITDRKKELIKTAGGKYVAPQKIENLLKTRPLISQAVVVGDQLKYCVALLTLEPATLTTWVRDHGLERADITAVVKDERLLAAVQGDVDAVNAHLASYETIKYFRIIPREFTVEDGELTPSLKIKRRVIERKFADEIASMV
jgi:long-chain acyl-CoA synthetase